MDVSYTQKLCISQENHVDTTKSPKAAVRRYLPLPQKKSMKTSMINIHKPSVVWLQIQN